MARMHARTVAGKTVTPSIYRHGYEFVAERIVAATRAGAVTVIADRERGTVTYKRKLTDEQLLALSSQPNYIGTFTAQDRRDSIEDDLLDWMRGGGSA